MSDYSRKFGGGKRGRYGQANYLNPETLPALDWRTFTSFAGGYDARDSRQDVAENSSPYTTDIEVSVKDQLMRAPGVVQVEAIVGRVPSQMILHASLDYTAELVLLDAPYVGAKRSGATVWTDAGIETSDGLYGWTNFGGRLVFSSGKSKVYVRDPDSSVVGTLEEAPPAETYATFAGRLFAGNVVVDGKKENLGIVWNAVDGLAENWFGLGGGYELLIDNALVGDKIVALRTMSFDLMAILCRRSIWVATRTGQLDRPADFQIRFQGPGAIHAEACASTPFGVAYLSDGGVYLFDGNNSSMISDSINASLLPLDLSRIYEYSLYFHAGTKKLYLFTPTATWVLDIDRQRWVRRTLVARSATLFATQLDALTWADITTSWGGQNATWGSFGRQQVDTYDVYVLGMQGGTPAIGREDEAYDQYFDLEQDPVWEFQLVQGPYMNQLVTNSVILLEYEGAGTVQFWNTDINGEYTPTVQRVLTSGGGGPVVTQIPYAYTGMGLGLRLKILSGFPKVSKIQLGFVPQGPRIETGTFAKREYYEDFQG